MVEIISCERKSAVLAPSSIPCLARMPTINLTAGCAHGCAYCYARGYSSYPGEGQVVWYANTLAKLRAELGRKRRRPQAVYFSSSSDLFQPLSEVLDMAYEILELLLERGIGVALLTKGEIPARHRRLLLAHAPRVRARFGLLTLDQTLLNVFEPAAAPAEVRLSQAEELIAGGISTEFRIDPILPGLTDDPPTLDALCARLAAIGVRRVAASTLFLRPAILQSFRRHVPEPLLAPLVERFTGGQRLALYGGKRSVRALPAADRQAIYDRLRGIARSHSLEVSVCACKNGDLKAGDCTPAGRWPPPVRAGQLYLFAR